MKKTARKKTSNVKKTVILKETEPTQEELEQVIIPPDIVETEVIDTEVNDVEQLSQNVDPLVEVSEQLSFYEKVTGKKPPLIMEEKNGEIQSGYDRRRQHKAREINVKSFFLGIVVFLLTVIITSIVGFFLLRPQVIWQGKVSEKNIETIPTPTLVPPVVLNKNDWAFEVLNGSGKAGEAAKASEKIKALGYEVIKVGNAEENVDSSQVFVTKGRSKDDIKAVLNDLKSDFGELKVAGELKESTASVRIILGKGM